MLFYFCVGYRIGRGHGAEDLEYAMMRSMGVIDENTPIITTVHDCQIVDIPDDMVEDHDFDVRNNQDMILINFIIAVLYQYLPSLLSLALIEYKVVIVSHTPT